MKPQEIPQNILAVVRLSSKPLCASRLVLITKKIYGPPPLVSSGIGFSFPREGLYFTCVVLLNEPAKRSMARHIESPIKIIVSESGFRGSNKFSLFRRSTKITRSCSLLRNFFCRIRKSARLCVAAIELRCVVP